jgi:hypothetical protein
MDQVLEIWSRIIISLTVLAATIDSKNIECEQKSFITFAGQIEFCETSRIMNFA